MRYKNNVLNKKVADAISVATDLFEPTSRMIHEIRSKDDWKYNSGTGKEVALRLTIPGAAVDVFTYRPKNPFTRAIGNFNGKEIQLNLYALSWLTEEQLIGLLLHERAHFCGFNHGSGWFANYKTADKCQYSVPYFLSENVAKWI